MYKYKLKVKTAHDEKQPENVTMLQEESESCSYNN